MFESAQPAEADAGADRDIVSLRRALDCYTGHPLKGATTSG